MKKVLFILLSCFLVLGACGNNDSNSKKMTSVDENKVQFTNDTLVLDQAVLKIKDTFLVNDKDSDNGKKLLAFKYEVKSKDGNEQITPMNVWIASMETTQDSENTESKLEVGPTPNTGKFEKWDKHNNDVIKKGKTAKGIITYELENDKQVTLKATKGTEGKKLGIKKIDISKLKSVDYSAADDIINDSASSSKEDSKDVANNESENTFKSDNSKPQDNNGNNENPQMKQAQSSTNQSYERKQQVSQSQTNTSQSNKQQDNGYMTPSQIDEWNKTKPTTHDESQMEQVPQDHSGGHPSIFGTDTPPKNN
ncbi:DUF5067 domain-containing protein [Staphylococcus epidermidis]|jgi:ORF012|uniref:DUF5067 domain-containing protein n=1 Tax=Staphylococcus epidermidis TaxID=1282 RepID=UPI00138DE1AD|nr:DUF5067 domain-containing protein [Staphylococcus epidermidis]MCO6231277.1 DUF5067 domain-containing protein [Staphylococcus epidermidis]